MTKQLHVALALEGYGWHPEAWRHTPDRQSILSGRYWADLAVEAERGLLDFVTFDDGLSPQRRRRPGVDPRWLAGRPDAVLVASRVSTATTHVGLIPVATVTHTDPFHVATTIATLDALSHGRAGWQPRVTSAAHEAQLFGRGDVPGDLFADALEAVHAVRGHWDDPTISPNPPQGHPVVAVLAHSRPVYEFAARSADLVFITPKDDEQLVGILGEIDDVGGADLEVYADVFVAASGVVDLRSDAYVLDGAAAELVDLAVRWQGLGVDGIRLRPAVNATDLPFIVDGFLPALREAGAFPSAYADGENLRHRLGLSAADNRYSKVGQS